MDIADIERLSKEVKELNDKGHFFIMLNQKEILSLENRVLNNSDYEHFKNNIVICGKGPEEVNSNFDYFMGLWNKATTKTSDYSITVYKLPFIETKEHFWRVIQASLMSQSMEKAFKNTFMPQAFCPPPNFDYNINPFFVRWR